MTIHELLRLGTERLEKSGVPSPRYDCEYLLAEALQTPRLNLLLSLRDEAFPEQEQAFFKLLSRRENREPLQYILGWEEFYGFPFKVAPGVLIPRADTETLCEQALLRLPEKEPTDVLDLCTGSGALAVAIQKLRPHARVHASDLSTDALAIAKENAALNHADILFHQGDLFAPLDGLQFDLIVSNPPYIPFRDMPHLQEEVKMEPAMALLGGPDGLDFYRRIVSHAPLYLKAGGHLCLEIGDSQGADVMQLMEKDFTDIQLYEDLSGHPRAVCGKVIKND